MSVLDAETGKVVRHIPGLNPDGKWQENIVSKAAISPDQRLVAAVYMTMYGPSVDRRIGIYATDDWRRVTALSFGGSDTVFGAQAIAFSPDGTMFAVAYTDNLGNNGRVDIFDVGSWILKRTIDAFPENPPPQKWAHISHVSFNHDGSMIAVASSHGGTFWHYPDGRLAPTGVGTPVPGFPTDPIRVFKVSNGARVGSIGGEFSGAPFLPQEVAWSPKRNFLAFLDSDHILHFWNPSTTGPSLVVKQFERATTAISFSPDGTILGQSFGDGVRLFELVDSIRG